MASLLEFYEYLARYIADLSVGVAVKGAVAGAVWLFLLMFDLNNPAHKALVLLMCFDYLLGAAHALNADNFISRYFWRGLAKFLVYGIAVVIADLADRGMGPVLFGFSFSAAVCAYLVANEAISSLTHLGEFGVPIPPWIMERLRRYRNNIERAPKQPHPAEPLDAEGEHHDRPL